MTKQKDGENVERFEAYKLSTIMGKLGHKKLSICKMDVEGAEIDVLKNIIDENIEIDQILVEFHHRFKSVGTVAVKETIALLRSAGYKVFFISKSGEEYSFIHSKLFVASMGKRKHRKQIIRRIKNGFCRLIKM